MSTLRKNIFLEPPARFISSYDASKEFHNELSPVNNIDLTDLISANHDNQYVIVYELNEANNVNKILAFIVIWDHVPILN